MRSDYNDFYHGRHSNRRVVDMKNVGWFVSTLISRMFWVVFAHDMCEVAKALASILNEASAYNPHFWLWEHIGWSSIALMIAGALWSIYRNGPQIFGLSYLAKWMAKEEFKKFMRAQRMREREHRAQRIDISGRRDVDYYDRDHRIAK